MYLTVDIIQCDVNCCQFQDSTYKMLCIPHLIPAHVCFYLSRISIGLCKSGTTFPDSYLNSGGKGLFCIADVIRAFHTSVYFRAASQSLGVIDKIISWRVSYFSLSCKTGAMKVTLSPYISDTQYTIYP